FAPRRDDPDFRVERVVAELEPHLVVALAGGAVRHRIGAGLVRDLDLTLGDQRPRDRGAEKIHAFIQRVGAEHREDEVAHELLSLAEVGGEGNHLAAVFLLQPAQDHRRIEPAGIGEHNLFYAFRCGCRHGRSTPWEMLAQYRDWRNPYKGRTRPGTISSVAVT